MGCCLSTQKAEVKKSPLSYLTEIVRAAGPFVSLSYTPPYAGPKTKMNNVTKKSKLLQMQYLVGEPMRRAAPFPKGVQKMKNSVRPWATPLRALLELTP